jgi:hypothetical protein
LVDQKLFWFTMTQMEIAANVMMMIIVKEYQLRWNLLFSSLRIYVSPIPNRFCISHCSQ